MSGGNNVQGDPTPGSKKSRANRISFKHAVHKVTSFKERNSGNAANPSTNPNSTVRISRPGKAPAKVSPDQDTITPMAVCMHSKANANNQGNNHDRDQGNMVRASPNLNPIPSRARTISTDDEGNISCPMPVVARRQSGRTDKHYRRVASFCGSSEFAVSSLVSARAKNERAESTLSPIKASDKSKPLNSNASFHVPSLSKVQPGKNKALNASSTESTPRRVEQSSHVSAGAKNERAESTLSPLKASDKSHPLNFNASLHVRSLPKVQPGKNKGLNASSTDSMPRRVERLSVNLGAQRNHKDFHCKCWKPSNLESICYIGNDGKIAAAKMVGAQVHHVHQCNVSGCLCGPQLRHTYQRNLSGSVANASCHLSSKHWLGQQQSSPSEAEKSKSNFPSLHDFDSISNSSLNEGSYLALLSAGNSTCFERSNIECGGRNSPCLNVRDDSEHNSAQPIDIVSACKEFLPCDLSNIALIPRCGSIGLDKSQDVDYEVNKREGFESLTPVICQPKCLFHHANNELSGTDDGTMSYHTNNELNGTDDGTNVIITPVSESQNTFNDFSNTDANILSSVAEHLTLKGSRTSRMRKKFLDALRQQEAETVRLRKQEIQARKNAEDWRIDSAMEELLHRLAPNGEACVRVLVEAFETVSDQGQLAAHDHEDYSSDQRRL